MKNLLSASFVVFSLLAFPLTSHADEGKPHKGEWKKFRQECLASNPSLKDDRKAMRECVHEKMKAAKAAAGQAQVPAPAQQPSPNPQ